ncbi:MULTISPECIES: helix-turn-helix domain-containing protein [unclassified Amycolatopsis]|uniref:helix-turn-helix domain-containing protein n=1 Tax=unclassified Amycolatopsis TaxID=2618356 RepID=UPI001EE7FED0|nr:helix-turn-helix transcriptional regulator [Amycolatopsis sp. Poz14]MCG3751921.1 helix-turn-helix domain-containing protein [Amycolatopsis sp. Poz14]
MRTNQHARDNALGDFLRARRADISPDQVGFLNTGHPRRVAGLRRAEVAKLASISTEYYTRIEQGRLPPSTGVLGCIADALRLDADQVHYLHQLADRSTNSPTVGELQPQSVHPQTLRLVRSMNDAPALVLGRHMNILAWNPLAAALYTDFGALPAAERNLLRLTFLHPGVRALYTDQDWEENSRLCVAFARMDAASSPADPELDRLVEDLCAGNDDFRRLWASHQVALKTFGTKRYQHPVAGELIMDWQMLTCPHDPEQSVVFMSAAPGSATENGLRLLSAWAAGRSNQAGTETPPQHESRPDLPPLGDPGGHS